ncbi:MAG: tRNA dihydrouridine synthase DusB [Chlamydiota bacterium]
MKKYVNPLQLGSLQLRSNVLYSPLAGCSDYPFRQMVARYRPGLMYCEMVKMDALIRHDPNTYRFLDYDASMRPIGAQICGSKPSLAGPCAKIIEDLGFDIIDLNCGCPVDKVTKDGSGSGLLKTPDLIGEILANMIAAVKIPVTVKIRAGWDDDHINATDITQIAEAAGAKAIAIHGRTRVQKYTGRSNRATIRACKQTAKSILVIGNGDVFTAQDGLDLFADTGCDAILISRGTMGTPWIAQQIEALDQAKPLSPLTGNTCKEALLKHFSFILAYQSDKKALIDLRRIGCWYLRPWRGTKQLRCALNTATTVAAAKALIHHYDWSQVDVPNKPQT